MNLEQTTLGALDLLNQLYQVIAVPQNAVLLALLGLGYLLRAMPVVNNKYIPLILLAFGISACLFIISPAHIAVIHGVIFTALSVFCYEMVKNYLQNYFTKFFRKDE
jgi:hypothetical protein